MTMNPGIMPNMMIAETAGKLFDGGCHCGALWFRVIGPAGKILIRYFYDCVCTARLSWAGIDEVLDHFHLIKDASLKWYNSSAIVKRSFCRDCAVSLFY